MKKLFAFPGRSSPGLLKLALPQSSLSVTALAQRYSTQNDDDSREIVDKARSTAEEFLRQAKQKAESLKESAKETIVGESKDGKENLKEKVEKGKSDHVGRD